MIPLVGRKFGDSGHLTVIGWFGERVGTNKKYTVSCSVCSLDSEMYGIGEFLITKSHLLSNKIPCGCSPLYRRNPTQSEILIKRVCGKDYHFICWAEPYKGKETKMILLNCSYGISSTVTIHNFLSGQRCRLKSVANMDNKQDYNSAVVDFFESGSFHKETLFTRSERKTKQGYNLYWRVRCGYCEETYESLSSNLKAGCCGCSCSRRRHLYSYIHSIQGGEFIKFGISTKRDQTHRLERQSKKSGKIIESIGSWEFSSVSECRLAEQSCKSVMECCVMTKDEMPDGFTETTYYENIDLIESIYELHGGVRIS